MALCENFDCLRLTTCKFGAKYPKCQNGCLIALDIHKCSGCRNRENCKGTELYNQRQAEREYWLNKKR